jgi:tryptophan synthase beta chain
LIRARALEKALDTPARIYFKYEGVSPTGSHKPNSAVAQAYYNKKEGVRRITTETGAGQWGSSLAFACNHFGLECLIYMVKVSYNQKPYRKNMMELFGARVVASPSTETDAGRKILSETPDSPGSLGIAISEAVEMAVKDEHTKYSLGSVLNFVVLHQTIIGLETEKQLALAGEKPDVLLASFGGGSNFGGFVLPFVNRKIKGESMRIVAVEPAACPTLTRGVFAYDFGDAIGMTPLMPMHTLGHDFIPSPIHAGGLRYHGAAPIISHALNQNLIEAVALKQNDCFASAALFAKVQGIIPAPESTHAVHGAMREALRCREEGKSEVIVFNLSGHGHLDMSAYDAFLQGKLGDGEMSDAELQKNLAAVRKI